MNPFHRGVLEDPVSLIGGAGAIGNVYGNLYAVASPEQRSALNERLQNAAARAADLQNAAAWGTRASSKPLRYRHSRYYDGPRKHFRAAT